MEYLIGYDITDEKRLQKIHHCLIKLAFPIQYSVFLFEGNVADLTHCIDEILSLMNKKEDDLRIYPIPSNAKKWRIGKSALPEGIILTSLPIALTNY